MKPTLLAVLVLSLLTVATPRVATEALLAQSIANGQSSCRSGDRGRPIAVERVASHPTAASVRDYFDEWVAFYQDFYQSPEIPATFTYGFDSYKIVERLRSRGADVSVRTLTGFDHVNSWMQAMPRAARWFRSLE